MSTDQASAEAPAEEITRLKQQNDTLSKRNAELEALLAAQSGATIYADIFEQLPVAVGVFRSDGLMVHTNAEAERMFGLPRDIGIGRYNPLEEPQAIAVGTPAVFAKVLQGATITLPPYQYDTTKLPDNTQGRVLWVETVYSPLSSADGTITHIVTTNRDVTVEIEQRDALADAARAVEAGQRRVAEQQEIITALSSPVIQVWEGILTISLIGVIDARRAGAFTQDLLDSIVRYSAECVLLDVTAVSKMDSSIVGYLIAATHACRLLGCEVALVGIGPVMAQAIVHLGVDLSQIVTRANLKAGIAWAFARRGLTVVPAQPG